MNGRRQRRRKKECLKHREIVYCYALDKLIAGEIPPEYVSQRFKKLKEVR